MVKEWRQQEFDRLVAAMVEMLAEHVQKEMRRRTWKSARLHTWGNYSKLRIDRVRGQGVAEIHVPTAGPDFAFIKLLEQARKMMRRQSRKWTGFLLTFFP